MNEQKTVPGENPKRDSESNNANARDSPLRRLRRENHLLRLQLLKLREQQRILASQVAATGPVGSHETASSLSVDAAGQLAVAGAACTTDDETAAMRARTLQRQEARQQRTTSARALFTGGVPPSNGDDHSVAESNKPAAPAADADSRPWTAPPPPSTVTAQVQSPLAAADTAMQLPAPNEPTAAEDDLSAQAMLQRFQNRKAQRRLRLEQMLGPGREGSIVDDVMPETTPFGNAPRHPTAPADDLAPSGANSSSNSSVALGGAATLENTFTPDEPLNANDSGITIGHRTARGGETTGSAPATPAGPTQNPNQIGRVVADTVKNNSWYLCKVLEAALLDTIQARHVVDDTTTPARTPTHTSPLPLSPPTPDSTIAHDSKEGEMISTEAKAAGSTAAMPSTAPSPPAARNTPTSTDAPPFLSQLGISDTALRRAIEESLVLPFRCIHDAPQRLTSQQAAEEAVPPFEAENKDTELRRCFGGHARRPSADRGGGTSPETGAEDDNSGAAGASPTVVGADDNNLDPFARLLLARISAELPSGIEKGEKKRKGYRGSGSGNGGAGGKAGDDVAQNAFYGAADGALGKTAPPSSPSTAKANAAFVMAAAGGDGKVHIPKQHFSRLDEVQVEMHAPVIFNLIRGFLHLDIDRFRRSFLQNGQRGDVVDGVRSSSAGDGAPFRCSPQPAPPRKRTGGGGGGGSNGVGGAEEATAWRISVSPGKSGTTLLYFGDYVMKTVRPSEMEFFTRKFLPAYVRYCARNPHTLLPRFYALVTVRWWKAGMAQHFVLMHNVFATPYYIHRIYDVKGSTVNRTALQPGKPPPRTAFGALLLKDNDLPPQLIICGAYQRAILLAQFHSDVGFLRQLSIVDYSCMIGVRSRLFSREEGPSKTIVLQRHQHHDNDEPYVDPLGGGGEVTNVTSAAADAGAQTVNVALAASGGQLSLPAGDQVASDDDVYICIHGCDGGLLSLPIYSPGDDTTAREDVYYLGIIDVLQTYNSAKKLESFAKGFVNDRQAISVIPPDGYSERLYKVLERITV